MPPLLLDWKLRILYWPGRSMVVLPALNFIQACHCHSICAGFKCGEPVKFNIRNQASLTIIIRIYDYIEI
jgi:hypothetical protein